MILWLLACTGTGDPVDSSDVCASAPVVTWESFGHGFLIENCDTCPVRVVCRCLQVTEDEVVTMIAALGLRTVHEVQRVTGAGDGCTCCHEEIRKQLQVVNSLSFASS